MKLATKTRYAVRAVFDIAFHGDGKPTQAREVAVRQEIPARYLEQIFAELRRGGIVDGRRGPAGGYVLTRGPEQIRLGDVVRAMEGPIEQLFEEPLGGESTSGDLRLAATVWRELGREVAAAFDRVTVRDLCARAEALGLLRGAPHGHMYFI